MSTLAPTQSALTPDQLLDQAIAMGHAEVSTILEFAIGQLVALKNSSDDGDEAYKRQLDQVTPPLKKLCELIGNKYGTVVSSPEAKIAAVFYDHSRRR